MKASERRKQLKRARRLESEIKAELKNDIAEFLADYWLSQFGDLEKACKELLLDADRGFKHMKRKDLIKALEQATEELNSPKSRYIYGKYPSYADRKAHYDTTNGFSDLRKDFIQRSEALMTRLMEEIIGIGVKPDYEPEGRKPEPPMEYYND